MITKKIIKKIIKNLITNPIYLLISIILSPVIIFIRLIRPKFLIRFGRIRDDRIGHFIADSSEKIALKRKNKKNKIIDCFWISNKPINKYWANLIGKYLNISYLYRFLQIANNFIPGGEEHNTNSSETKSKDIYGYYYKYDLSIEFPKNLMLKGISFLKDYGWDEKKKIICLNIRDDLYLQKISRNRDWSYHDYRNSPINNYTKSVSWLINKGYFVIRTGSIAKDKIQICSKDFIDYPFLKNKNQLFDLLLPSFASYWIGSGTGLDEIPKIKKIPTLFINFLPIYDYNFYNNSETAPKKLFWNETGKALSLHEYLRNPFYRTSDYEKNKIKVIDLNEFEIFEIIKDFFIRIENPINKLNIKDEFFEIYKNYYYKNKRKKRTLYKHPNSKINPKWLEISKRDFLI